MNSNSATLIFFSLQLHSKIAGEDACHLYVSSAIKLNCKKVECLLGRKSCGLLQWITKTLSLSSERPLQGRYFCALWWDLLVFNFFSYGKCHIREKLNQGFYILCIRTLHFNLTFYHLTGLRKRGEVWLLWYPGVDVLCWHNTEVFLLFKKNFL